MNFRNAGKNVPFKALHSFHRLCFAHGNLKTEIVTVPKYFVIMFYLSGFREGLVKDKLWNRGNLQPKPA